MGKTMTLEESPWRLISIKGQSVPYEIPMYVCTRCVCYVCLVGLLAVLKMHLTESLLCCVIFTPRNPNTIMRNELISQGGSGVPINRQAYMKSVEYWKNHAIVI